MNCEMQKKQCSWVIMQLYENLSGKCKRVHDIDTEI